jgi:hypothetical protein
MGRVIVLAIISQTHQVTLAPLTSSNEVPM